MNSINLRSGHRVAESLIVAGQGIEKENVRVMAMTLNTSPAIDLALKRLSWGSYRRFWP